MTYPNHETCPECGEKSLPPFSNGDAVACQNQQCRVVVDRTGLKLGRFTKGYGKLELFSARAAAVGLLALLMFAAGAAAQQRDPYAGVDPHEVPACSPKGGNGSARCRCLGMVADIQRERASRCWRESGVAIPEDRHEASIVLRILAYEAPPEVAACMEATPDHCEIVARGRSYWSYRGPRSNDCRTRCKPERCGCADQACKAHGAEGAGY